MKEPRLRELLHGVRVPDERGARERSWRVVQAAYAGRQAVPGRAPYRRLALAAVVAAALLSLVLSPAGAKVGGWIEDIVARGERARPSLTSLPASGRLLVTSEQGAWTVQEDGSKRLLGSFDQASWSPRGLFVAAADGHQLVALEPDGAVHWTVSQPRTIADPRWSPSGFRIAYRSGSSLRVVAGDGSGDRPLARDVAAIAPAWHPATTQLKESPAGAGVHLLAFANRRGRVRLIDADSERVLWRSAPGPVPFELAWSADGTLLAPSAHRMRAFTSSGDPVPLPELSVHGRRAVDVAVSTVTPTYALAVAHQGAHGGLRTEILLGERSTAAPERRLFAGPGEVSDLTWSPDGRWLLAGWKSADQWLFLPTTGSASRRTVAVSSISTQFAPGTEGPAAFPQVEGWCCPG